MQVLSQDNFKVLIRVRPLNPKQKQQISTYQQSHSKKLKGSLSKSVKMSPAIYSFYTKFYNCNIDEVIKIHKKTNTISVADQQYKNTDRKMRPYTYSGVYDVNDKNKSIFTDNLKDHVSSVLDGYNCTILAYGITGSGKTYTVFGPNNKKYNSNNNTNNNNNSNSNSNLNINNINNNNNLQSNFNTFNANANNNATNNINNNNENIQQQVQGISYITFQYLLKQKNRLLAEKNIKISYKLSFIQIYNENARDLLTNDKERQNKFLNIVQDCKGNTTIADVTQISIQTIQQVYNYINMGNMKRAFASTIANQYSSRSHAILQLMVETQKNNGERTLAKLYIIDLAGSQKLQTLNCSKKMQQGANINRSLLALGNCINTLAENSRKNIISHIPYRDSKLTRMLKDSLGGNTKTIMIACISPNPFLIDQTMTTLNYAMRAQGIKKKIIKNQLQCDKQQKLQYLCLKCKKSSKVDEEFQDIVLHQHNYQKQQSKQIKLKQRSSSLSNIPSIQSSTLLKNNTYQYNNNNNKISQKLELLQSLYQDIITNIKQSQSLKSFSNNHIYNDSELLKIKCINQEQRIKLKQVLFDIFMSKNKQNFKNNYQFNDNYNENNQNSGCFTIKGSKVHTQQYQNKQNNQQYGKDSQTKSVSSTKSKRRRSHNKFQIVKKSDSLCKTVDFE